MKKDSKYFTISDELLSKDPKNIISSSSDDVREKYISELQAYKDSWMSIVGWIFLGVGIFIAFQVVDGSPKGIEWLFVFLFPVLAVSGIGKLLKKTMGSKSKLQNHSDKMLELHYNEMKEKQRFKKLSSQIITAIVAVGIGILFFLALLSENDNKIKRIWNNITTDAKCSVISANANEDSFLISGKPDYGITVSTKIKNVGKKGNVFVTSKLLSSEGDFERKQTIFMEAGAVKRLKYQFAELTIYAKNVKYPVSCSPSEN